MSIIFINVGLKQSYQGHICALEHGEYGCHIVIPFSSLTVHTVGYKTVMVETGKFCWYFIDVSQSYRL